MVIGIVECLGQIIDLIGHRHLGNGHHIFPQQTSIELHLLAIVPTGAGIELNAIGVKAGVIVILLQSLQISGQIHNLIGTGYDGTHIVVHQYLSIQNCHVIRAIQLGRFKGLSAEIRGIGF